MASVAGLLDQALRTANIPIVGVSITDVANRATWTVLFLESATDTDRTNAQDIVNAVVVDAAALRDADAVGDLDQKAMKAVLIALWECIPAPTMTKAQARARAIAIYRAL